MRTAAPGIGRPCALNTMSSLRDPCANAVPAPAAINRITNEKEAIKYLISRIISMNPFTVNRFRVNPLEIDSSNQLPWWRDVGLGRDWEGPVSGLGTLP